MEGISLAHWGLLCAGLASAGCCNHPVEALLFVRLSAIIVNCLFDPRSNKAEADIAIDNEDLAGRCFAAVRELMGIAVD
jgi:hypothetical protein